jgi:hypothetical protein
MNGKSANKQAVKWKTDPSYQTQTSYFFEAPVLLEVGPEFGPDTDLAPGAGLVSVRAFELFRDGTDRERRGLAQRRMYRVAAPWSQENPIMVHVISSRPDVIRNMIDQAAEVGFELIILSFGSGLNMESTDPAYQAIYREPDHPGHRGLADSQWVQFQAIAEFYRWCRANGVYLNVPDWYFLNGSSKTAMGYKETNWSLPRAEQEIRERQNVYDGTWEKTSSMGWMFVPLTQYHGGGAAATLEPLQDHLPHYEARLADLFGAEVVCSIQD